MRTASPAVQPGEVRRGGVDDKIVKQTPSRRDPMQAPDRAGPGLWLQCIRPRPGRVRAAQRGWKLAAVDWRDLDGTIFLPR